MWFIDTMLKFVKQFQDGITNIKTFMLRLYVNGARCSLQHRSYLFLCHVFVEC